MRSNSYPQGYDGPFECPQTELSAVMATFADIARVTWIFGLHGPTGIEDEAELSVWGGFDPAHLPTSWATDLADFASAMYGAWADHADDAVFRTSVTLESVKVSHLDSTRHTQHEGVHSPSTKWAGTATGASLPWQDALAIGLYSYTPGTFIPNARRRRGRVYLPPMTVAVLDIPTKGTLSDSRVVDTMTWVKDMLFVGTNYEFPSTSVGLEFPQVYSRVANELYAITDLAADQVIDSQRRRTHQETKNRQSIQYTP